MLKPVSLHGGAGDDDEIAYLDDDALTFGDSGAGDEGGGGATVLDEQLFLQMLQSGSLTSVTVGSGVAGAPSSQPSVVVGQKVPAVTKVRPSTNVASAGTLEGRFRILRPAAGRY